MKPSRAPWLGGGKSLMRDLVNATVGFEDLGSRLQTSPKSLMRMLSAAGNPQARNLLAVLEALQDVAGVRLRVVSAAAARPARAVPRPRR